MNDLESKLPTQPDPTAPYAETPPASRPTSVTLLAVGVIIIAVLSLLRLVLALRYWDYLDGLTRVPPLYLVLSGLFWALAGVPLAFGLLRRRAWAPNLMRALTLSYALYFWLDQVFLQEHPLAHAEGGARLLLPGNWPFLAGLTALILVFTAWTLKRPASKAYFGEIDEPFTQDETPE